MIKNAKIGLSLVAVLFLAAGCNSSRPAPKTIQDNDQASPAAQQAQPAPAAGTEVKLGAETGAQNPVMANQIKTFTVKGQNFSFAPAEIRVKKGDKVKVVFENAGGFHDFVIDEFKARTKQISDGKTDTVEFTADKAGTFEYYCSVGSHRAMGMKGKLVVE